MTPHGKKDHLSVRGKPLNGFSVILLQSQYNLVRDLPQRPVTGGTGFGMGKSWKGLKEIASEAGKDI